MGSVSSQRNSKKDYVFTVNLVLIMERNVETRFFPSNPIAEGF